MQTKSDKKLKIALLGYGKMGKLIEQEALLQGHEIVAKWGRLDQPSEGLQCDVAIDFSHADCVFDNIAWAVRKKIPLVIGTTGWEENINENLRSMPVDSAIVFSPNFSIGMNLFFNLIKKAGALFNQAEEYDISISEVHHNQKKDSPSGTAKHIADILISTIERKNTVVNGVCEQPKPHELLISSQRVGHVPGIHRVLFDSTCDTIEISHTARNRLGFARGALFAAEWIVGKKGWHHFENCFSI